MRLLLRVAALPFTILFAWRRPGYRALIIASFVMFLVLLSAHFAQAVDSGEQPSGDPSPQSINPYDRPDEPLDSTETGNSAQPQDDPTLAANDDCQGALGLPASIGCRLASAGGGGVVAGVVGAAASSVFDGFVDSVADGAVYFLSEIASFLDTSTRPDVQAPWFVRQYDAMAGLAVLVLLPLVLVAIIDAVVHARPGQIARTLFIFVPVAAIGTYVTLELVDMALVITDWASAFVSGGIAADTSAFLEGLGQVLSGAGGEQLPTFAVFIGAIFTVFGAFLLWIELILRTAGINLAVLFLPLAFATLVWPRVSRWASKALRLLAALILSKFFIVAVISLGASLLGGGGAGATGAGGGGLEAVIAGVSLIALATFAPWLLWRALAPVEGAAVLALAGAGRGSTRRADQREAGGQITGVVSRLGSRAGGPLPVAGVPVAGATAGAARAARGAGTAAGGAAVGATAGSSAARANAAASARRRAAASGGGNESGPGSVTAPGSGSGRRGSGGDGKRPSAPPAATGGASSSSPGAIPVRSDPPGAPNPGGQPGRKAPPPSPPSGPEGRT